MKFKIGKKKNQEHGIKVCEEFNCHGAKCKGKGVITDNVINRLDDIKDLPTDEQDAYREDVRAEIKNVKSGVKFDRNQSDAFHMQELAKLFQFELNYDFFMSNFNVVPQSILSKETKDKLNKFDTTPKRSILMDNFKLS